MRQHAKHCNGYEVASTQIFAAFACYLACWDIGLEEMQKSRSQCEGRGFDPLPLQSEFIE